MKKKVKAQVINADWEIKKYEMRQKVKKIIAGSKEYVEIGVKCFAFGAGVGLIVIVNDKLF